MNIVKATFACLAAVLLAAPAGAVTVTIDGVVIITQADVNAGGITPGDTPGFPASILVSGSYRLGSSLTMPNTLRNGIVVSAPNVSIDLNGFTLSGSNAGRNGIYSEQLNTSITNGVVTKFTQYGIVSTVGSLNVDHMTVTYNGSTGLDDSELDSQRTGNSSFTNNLVLGNGAHGINCADNCLAQNNRIVGNAREGIIVYNTGNVLGNVIAENGEYGIIAPANSGYGNNTIGNNGFGSVIAGITPFQPNACDPACPPPVP